MAGSIVPKTNGDLAADIGHTTEVSWEPPAKLTFKMWEQIGCTLQTVNAAVNWWIGDWLNVGEKKYGDTYTQAINVTDSSVEALKKYKSVSERVPKDIRTAKLSWTHHFYVAYVPEDERGPLLSIAEEFSLSSRELKKLVQRKAEDRAKIVDAYLKESDGYWTSVNDLTLKAIGSTISTEIFEEEAYGDGESYQDTPYDSPEYSSIDTPGPQNGNGDLGDLPFSDLSDAVPDIPRPEIPSKQKKKPQNPTKYAEDDDEVVSTVIQFFEDSGIPIVDAGKWFIEFSNGLRMIADLDENGDPILLWELP